MSLLTELLNLQEQHGWLSKDRLRTLAKQCNVPLHQLQSLVSFYTHFQTTPPAPLELHVCRDMTCHLRGATQQADLLKKRITDTHHTVIKEVSCIGRCDKAPVADIAGCPFSITDLTASDANATDLTDFVPPPLAPSRMIPWDEDRFRSNPYHSEKKHYQALTTMLDQTQGAERVIQTLKESGLKGMGGAGFPTGVKWELVRNQPGHPKYVVVNADESEPGTFKDRALLEYFPHLVIEGMLIAAHCVGSQQAIIFIRHEYGQEKERMLAAIRKAEDRGLLTLVPLKQLLDNQNPEQSSLLEDKREESLVEVSLFVSPGGYILGEETALLEALEDKRGEPRNKPPFPGTAGLRNQPTLINNVETLAMIPVIMQQGGDWWKSQGCSSYEGLKYISVSGHITHPGIYEVPVGLPVSELIERAGGVESGKRLKAFAPGGASSMFLPAEKMDTPIDFKALQDAGSMLGSGALVVVAEGTNMLDIAANVVRFFRNESCGKCVPCRIGTQKTVALLDHVRSGTQPCEHLQVLPELAETLLQTSICGLGQVALNPILSVLEYFQTDLPSDTSSDT